MTSIQEEEPKQQLTQAEIDVELENLNLDGEQKQAEIIASPIPESNPNLIQDKEELQVYISKTISRQNISDDIITLEKDFYDNLQHYVLTSNVAKNMWYLIETFIAIRIDKLISHSLKFSQTIYDRLATPEKQRYNELCGSVDSLRREIYAKIKKQPQPT